MSIIPLRRMFFFRRSADRRRLSRLIDVQVWVRTLRNTTVSLLRYIDTINLRRYLNRVHSICANYQVYQLSWVRVRESQTAGQFLRQQCEKSCTFSGTVSSNYSLSRGKQVFYTFWLLQQHLLHFGQLGNWTQYHRQAWWHSVNMYLRSLPFFTNVRCHGHVTGWKPT